MSIIHPNTININQVDKRKNYCDEEKKIILNYVKQEHHVIENKSTDGQCIKAKFEKWKELEMILFHNGFNRSWKQLRAFYQRLKCYSKMEILKYRRAQRENVTPIKKPEPIVWEIYNISPEDFNDNESTDVSSYIHKTEMNFENDVSTETVLDSVTGELRYVESDEINYESPEQFPDNLPDQVFSNTNTKTKKRKSEFDEFENKVLRMFEEKHEVDMKLKRKELQHKDEIHMMELQERKLRIEKEKLMIRKLEMDLQQTEKQINTFATLRNILRD